MSIHEYQKYQKYPVSQYLYSKVTFKVPESRHATMMKVASNSVESALELISVVKNRYFIHRPENTTIKQLQSLLSPQYRFSTTAIHFHALSTLLEATFVMVACRDSGILKVTLE